MWCASASPLGVSRQCTPTVWHHYLHQPECRPTITHNNGTHTHTQACAPCRWAWRCGSSPSRRTPTTSGVRAGLSICTTRTDARVHLSYDVVAMRTNAHLSYPSIDLHPTPLRVCARRPPTTTQSTNQTIHLPTPTYNKNKTRHRRVLRLRERGARGQTPRAPADARAQVGGRPPPDGGALRGADPGRRVLPGPRPLPRHWHPRLLQVLRAGLGVGGVYQ